MFTDDDVTLTGIFGQTRPGKSRMYSTIIFTDYKNVQVNFVCGELKHFWYTEARIAYFISTRDRAFNSISQVAPHIEKLRELGADLNQIRFLKNDLTCKN